MLRDLLTCAGWDAARQAKEFASADWLDRVTREIIDREVARRIKPIGPVGARELSTKELFAKIGAPALRTAASAYAGSQALLLGKTGVGKTVAAILMARKAAGARELERLRGVHPERLPEQCGRRGDERASVAWVSCSELPRLVASQPFGREPELVELAKKAPLAVLDDLTWGANDKALLEIVAARYDHGLPTISTAGVTRAELVTRFGDAVVRRLLEHRGIKGIVVESF
jgi:DNA replication protein DnaC